MHILEEAGEPTFYYLHVLEPHTPYTPPEPYRSLYIDPDYEGPFSSGDGKILVLNADTAREWRFIFMGVGYTTGAPVAVVAEPLDASDQVACIEAGVPALLPFAREVTSPEVMLLTPVIAFNKGSMPELIEHGKNGFLVSGCEEAVEHVARIKNIDRLDCRHTVEDRFTADSMVEKYIDVYTEVHEKST